MYQKTKRMIYNLGGLAKFRSEVPLVQVKLGYVV